MGAGKVDEQKVGGFMGYTYTVLRVEIEDQQEVGLDNTGNASVLVVRSDQRRAGPTW